MAKFLGTDLIVSVGGVDIAHSTTCSLAINNHLIDSSSKSSTADDHLVGRYDWSIDFEALADYAATYGVEGIIDLILVSANQDFTVRISTSTSGDKYYEGTANLENVTYDGPNEDDASLSGTFKGKKALTKGTVN